MRPRAGNEAAVILTYQAGREGAQAMTPEGECPGMADAVWIDMADPQPHEVDAVQKAVSVELPTLEDMQEIEASSRVYQEDGASFMTITHVVGMDAGEPNGVPISFILTGRQLITIRFSDPKSFRSMTEYCTRFPVPETPLAVLLKLLDLIIDRTADILEVASNDIDAISRLAFGRDTPNAQRMSPDDLREILRRIGKAQYVVNKVHDSLLTLGRMVSFLNLPAPELAGGNGEESIAARRAKLDKRTREALRSAGRDVASLVEHSNYLTANIQFLLDAAMGRISIEQNAIIKIFSVAAVVFLPPTLVASIYGMNFEVMPELEWPLGYPFALGLMVLSAVLPYLWFKRKGWL